MQATHNYTCWLNYAPLKLGAQAASHMTCCWSYRKQGSNIYWQIFLLRKDVFSPRDFSVHEQNRTCSSCFQNEQTGKISPEHSTAPRRSAAYCASSCHCLEQITASSTCLRAPFVQQARRYRLTPGTGHGQRLHVRFCSPTIDLLLFPHAVSHLCVIRAGNPTIRPAAGLYHKYLWVHATANHHKSSFIFMTTVLCLFHPVT